eukprot:GGOE01021250.1.p1 GENE.GGOE01021250.1~~GGOE01021250.1.p1  ORF type:complete len:323 (-),score=51.11 GGOE01021250.1:325-1254(-)
MAQPSTLLNTTERIWPSGGDLPAFPSTGVRTGYKAGLSQISFEVPPRGTPVPPPSAELLAKLKQSKPITDEERLVALYSPARERPFLPPATVGFETPYAIDNDTRFLPPPRPLVKVVLPQPSPTWQPRRLMRLPPHPPGGLAGTVVLETTGGKLRTSRRHPQYATGASHPRDRNAPYWHTVPSLCNPHYSTKVLVPYPEDHVYQGMVDPIPQKKITGCIRRPLTETDHVKEIFTNLPTVLDYQVREKWVLQGPYGTDLVHEPTVGKGVRSTPYTVMPNFVPASPPGRMQRSKGAAYPAPRPVPLGWDLD